MDETLHEMAVRMAKGEDCKPQCGKGCDKCPAYALQSNGDMCLIRSMLDAYNCEEQIKGLMAWAAEHPAPRYPTWREWRNKMFDGWEFDIKPCIFASHSRFNCKEVRTCWECANKPIPADIAAKLGIKPIEEG